MSTLALKIQNILSQAVSSGMTIALVIAGITNFPFEKARAVATNQEQPSISAGYYHTCAVEDDGTVKCWGRNDFGLLGDGTNAPRGYPVTVSGLVDVKSVSAGYLHTCALISDGTVKCWGSNGSGRLGDGTSQVRFSPVAVANLNNVVAISAGYLHTCALISDGTVKCWGFNGQGRLGDGTTISRNTPVKVTGITNAESISAGYFHTCAMTKDKTPMCWGSNDFGQLGDGTKESKLSPVEVVGLLSPTSIAAGTRHTCAILVTKAVSCWGANELGLLGDGTDQARSTKVQVVGLTDVTSLAMGVAHTCALKSNGTVSCWGSNEYHQIGELNAPYTNQANDVLSEPDYHSLTATGFHSCVYSDSGVIRCWGSNDYGQVTGGSSSLFQNPVTVVGFIGNFSKTGSPTISGQLTVGSTLWANEGDWDADVTFTYQWLRDGEVIDGANLRSYIIREEDLLSKLSLELTASKTSRQRKIVISELSAPVWYEFPSLNSPCSKLGKFDETQSLIVIGNPKPGQILKGQSGTWPSGTRLCTFWLRDSNVIAASNKSYYKINVQDIGKSIRYAVIATYSSGEVIARVSGPVSVTKLTFDKAIPATFTRQPRVGLNVSAKSSSWAQGTTYTYKWLSDGFEIPGANSLSYTPTARDVGRTLSLLVCGVNISYVDRCLESASKIVVPGILTSLTNIAILGQAKVGFPLTLKQIPLPTDSQISIQWQLDGEVIPGANSLSYLPTREDRGKNIRATIRVVVDGYQELVRSTPQRRIY